MLTFEQVAAIIAYNPHTGKLSRVKDGQPTGGHNGNGYLQLNVLKRKFYAHRVAWLLHTGEWPKGQIDHINGNRSDNRFCNLRDVDQHTNMQNLKAAPKSARGGLLGASPDNGRFRAVIRVNGKPTHLGRFDTAEAAHAAYINAKRVHHAGCTI